MCDYEINANISSEGEGSLQPNSTLGPSTDPAQSMHVQAVVDPRINLTLRLIQVKNKLKGSKC